MISRVQNLQLLIPSSLSSSPNLFHRFLFLFPFFLFFFSQLLASPTRWIMNPQDRWYNNFPAFLSCGYPGSSTPFRSEYYPSERDYSRSKGNIRCHERKYQIGEVGAVRNAGRTVLIVKCDVRLWISDIINARDAPSICCCKFISITMWFTSWVHLIKLPLQ